MWFDIKNKLIIKTKERVFEIEENPLIGGLYNCKCPQIRGHRGVNF